MPKERNKADSYREKAYEGVTIQEFRDYMASGKPVVGGVPAKVIKKIEA